MTYQLLTSRREGPVEYLTLNRPEVRNAFNEALIGELTAWAHAMAADASVRVAVLAGAGPAFCAGADLAWMSRMAAYGAEENIRDATGAARLFAALDTLPFPLIGRVQGAAIGGGVGLAAVCDVVVADEHATFGLTEVKLGIVPAIISPYVLAKIGMSASRELFLTGIRVDAVRARDIGLVHAVVPASELDTRVRQYVQEVLGAGPEAIATAKALLKTIAHRPAQDVIGLTSETIAARRASAEGQEGMRAFLDKRTASWNAARSDR